MVIHPSVKEEYKKEDYKMNKGCHQSLSFFKGSGHPPCLNKKNGGGHHSHSLDEEWKWSSFSFVGKRNGGGLPPLLKEEENGGGHPPTLKEESEEWRWSSNRRLRKSIRIIEVNISLSLSLCLFNRGMEVAPPPSLKEEYKKNGRG